MNIVGEYVAHCHKQMATSLEIDKIKDESWMTQMKSCWTIVWKVIVENKAAGKQIDKFREGLDYLIEHFDM